MYVWFNKTTFSSSAQTFSAVKRVSGGQSVSYRLCLEAQAAYLFPTAPIGVGPSMKMIGVDAKQLQHQVY